jgi:superfamily II DNA or RNA helicase
MNLRDYQVNAKDLIKNFFVRGHKRVVLCMPTGAGKTVTFAFMVMEATKKGKKCMILCDRKELISQAQDKLRHFGIDSIAINPKWKGQTGLCYVASVDTLRNREIPEIDLLIVDEAHKSSFDSTLLRIHESVFVIGATATPIRKGNQKSLSDFYTQIVEPITIKQLLDQKHLVNARIFSNKLDMSDVSKKMGEFDSKEMFKKFDTPTLYDKVVENYIKYANNTKAICFCVNVAHSLETTAQFNRHGIKAIHLDGTTPHHEREQIIKDFQKGKFQILCNCSVLTTGFDEPSIETVIVNRATLSLELWLQMIGRGSRLFPNKEIFQILDMGGNVHRHGFYDDVRKWSLQKKAKQQGVAPTKQCKCCDSIVPASAVICQYCGAEFPVKEKEKKEVDFVEVKKKEKKEVIIQRGWVTPQIDYRKATLEELKEYAKMKGYKEGWAYKIKEQYADTNILR